MNCFVGEAFKDDPDQFVHHGLSRGEHPFSHLTCLEMSLSSGLGLLAIHSKFLHIHDTAHRIGVPELEWIQKHWHSLEDAKGLFRK